MNIIPDPILVVLQVIPFLVLLIGLNVILFKPMLAYLHDRDHATLGARKEAEQLASRAEAKLIEYEAALAAARSEVADFRTKRRAEAQAAWQVKVGAARQEADKRLASAMAGLARDTETARTELGQSARSLAAQAAAHVLGRPLVGTEA